MTRLLDSALAALLSASTLKPIFLFAGYFDSGTLRLWTGYGSLQALGHTWTNTGDFGGVSLVSESTEIRADGVRFVLSGMDPALVSIAEDEPYQNRKCELYLGALTDAGEVVGDPVLLFRGRMDVIRAVEGSETSTLELTAEHELAILQRPRVRRNTPEDLKLDYPDDTFFDYVAALQDREIELV